MGCDVEIFLLSRAREKSREAMIYVAPDHVVHGRDQHFALVHLGKRRRVKGGYLILGIMGNCDNGVCGPSNGIHRRGCFLDTSANALILGFLLAIFALLLWAIALIIEDPKGKIWKSVKSEM